MQTSSSRIRSESQEIAFSVLVIVLVVVDQLDVLLAGLLVVLPISAFI